MGIDHSLRVSRWDGPITRFARVILCTALRMERMLPPERPKSNVVWMVLFAIALLVSLPETAEPQKSGSITVARAPSLLKDLPSKIETLDTRYRFDSDGTGRKEVIGKIRILNQMGVLQRTQMTFEYQPFSEDLEVSYLRVRKKSGMVMSVEASTTQSPPGRATNAFVKVCPLAVANFTPVGQRQTRCKRSRCSAPPSDPWHQRLL